jgi:hypothetical protein
MTATWRGLDLPMMAKTVLDSLSTTAFSLSMTTLAIVDDLVSCSIMFPAVRKICAYIHDAYVPIVHIHIIHFPLCIFISFIV